MRLVLSLSRVLFERRRYAGHFEDLDFMSAIRVAPMSQLRTLLQWQCAEPWRRAAVTREINRRSAP